jgi:hypothetical protein
MINLLAFRHGLRASEVCDLLDRHARGYAFANRHSNRSLDGQHSAGKEFGEARDRGGIFGGTGRFQATETAAGRLISLRRLQDLG